MVYYILSEPGHGIVGGFEMVGSAVLFDCDLESLVYQWFLRFVSASAITGNKVNLGALSTAIGPPRNTMSQHNPPRVNNDIGT